MKKNFVFTLFLIITLFNIFNNIVLATSDISSNNTKFDPTYLTEIVDENNNVPAYQYYPNHVNSRGITTLKAYDDKIFMGIGDWNDNTGPVKIIYYDTTDNKIKSSGTINDEAVQLFNIIDDKLYTTGCDPKETWGYGSYYIYNKETNSWEQHLINSGWIHVFNIVEYNNKLFMCGSTTESMKRTQIQFSDDGGTTFKDITIIKNGEQLPYLQALRFYNLVVYNNKLYGYCYNNPYSGIYEYDETNNQFNYISKLPLAATPNYGLSASTWFNYVYFKNAIFNNTFLYVSGNQIYKSTDMKNFEAIVPDSETVVQDVAISGDTLYALCYKYDASVKKFTVKIYTTKNLEKFDLIYQFETGNLPFSFEYYNNNLYIGTSEYNDVSQEHANKTGTLYRISSVNELLENIVDTPNGKLPETGNFFNFRTILKTIIIVSTILVVLFVIKGKLTNK